MSSLLKSLARQIGLVCLSFSLFTLLFHQLHFVSRIHAQGEVLGIHVLHPYELQSAKAMLTPGQANDEWHYVTIPLSLAELDDAAEWQAFFTQAKELKIIPIVRLATRPEGDHWMVPNRRQVVELISFLSRLEWPTAEKHIIIFNEVNHAKEWGGTIDPTGYAETLAFASDWARSEQQNFIVLPAAMDLAAPNGSETMEAFTYLNKMAQAEPEIFSKMDRWNSHSYPNPGFSASPTLTGQNSIRGFEVELKYLKEKTGKDYLVFITETGWVVNAATQKYLEKYYTYALQHVWSHPQVVAVTPFLLRGDPGPFKSFTFLDQNDKPTVQYRAIQKALNTLKQAT